MESSSDGSVEDSDSDEDQEGANLVEEIRARGTQGDDDGGLGDDEDEKEDHGYLERLARARARAKETVSLLPHTATCFRHGSCFSVYPSPLVCLSFLSGGRLFPSFLSLHCVL